MYSIRQASASDIRRLRDLASSALPTAFDGVLTTEQIDMMYDRLYAQDVLQNDLQEGQIYFILNEQDTDCGFGSVIKQGPDLFLLPKIFILEEFRHKKLGRALFEHLLAYIKQIHPGPCTVELMLNHHNSSLGFYQKMGMHKVRDELFSLEDFTISQDVLSITI